MKLGDFYGIMYVNTKKMRSWSEHAKWS